MRCIAAPGIESFRECVVLVQNGIRMLYRSGSLKWDVVSGMWGIFRVKKNGIICKCGNLCRRAMKCPHKKADNT